MRAHRAVQLGITVLSVVALVASGASPISALPASLPPTPVLQSLVTPTQPAGIDIDSSGRVYVTGYAGGGGTEVSVYEPGSIYRNEGRTLEGLVGPSEVEVKDSTGEVYVANYSGDTISVFDPGATSPKRTLTGVTEPIGLAFGPAGNLFVASHTANKIFVFVGDSAVPSLAFATQAYPVGILVHPVTGDLYVTGESSTIVQVFDKGSTTPNVAKQLTLLNNSRDIAFDPASQSLYVTNYGINTVSVFAPGSTVPDPGRTLSGLSAPWGVAISPLTGDVYVSNCCDIGVMVFAGPVPTVSAVAPVAGPVTGGTPATITGSNLGAITGVLFGGAPASGVVAVSPTQVMATAPAHAVGTVDVSVQWGTRTAGLSQAFEYQAVEPGRASAVTGVPGNKQVTVSWTPPTDTGGVPVASYTVTPTPAGPACATTATSCVIGGLTNGTPYTFRVTTTNTAGLSSLSEPSVAVTPYISVSLKVKAKKASYRPPRKGTRTLVSYAKKASNATLVVTRSCTNGTALSSAKLCKFRVTKKGKVQVRVKGYKNVRVMISIVAVPKSKAGPAYGPSPTWTRTWRVK